MLVVAVVAEPTRIVGTRVVTLDGLVTPTRLLIYSGVFTVSVCTIDARAVFAFVFDALRDVTPGVCFAATLPVDRTVTDGRFETVFVAVARAVDAREAVVVAARDVVVFVRETVVGRVVTLRATFAFVTLRAATFRADVVVLDTTAREAAERPLALRGLTAVGTTGVTGCSGATSVSGSDSGSWGISSSMNWASGI